MGKMSRTKGKVFEREVANLFRAAGFEAQRTAPIQAGLPQLLPDVRVFVPLKENPEQRLTLKIECKRRAKLPGFLMEGLVNGNDLVLARANNEQSIVIMKPETLIGFLKAIGITREVSVDD